MRYSARFTGRQKGAIGIFYTCSCFVDGDTPEAARLALYDTYEHIQGLSLLPLVERFVPTHINKDGVREMATAAQGRNTYATADEAQGWIDAVLNPDTNSADVLRSVFGDVSTFAVRPVWCWPGHFDPIGIYFDTEGLA